MHAHVYPYQLKKGLLLFLLPPSRENLPRRAFAWRILGAWQPRLSTRLPDAGSSPSCSLGVRTAAGSPPETPVWCFVAAEGGATNRERKLWSQDESSRGGEREREKREIHTRRQTGSVKGDRRREAERAERRWFAARNPQSWAGPGGRRAWWSLLYVLSNRISVLSPIQTIVHLTLL